MSQPQWDEEMKFELFRLKSDLRIENFRVLATPLGLGQVQQDAAEAESPLFPSPPLATPVPAAAFQASVLLNAPPIPTKPLPPPQAIAMPLTRVENFEPIEENLDEQMTAYSQDSLVYQPRWIIYSRFILGHSLDLLFVGSSLAIGLLVLTWVTDPTHMSLDWSLLSQAFPINLLQKMRLWALLAGLYLVFTVYWLFFRFVSGQTLGESCVHSFSQDEEALSPQPSKLSEKT